MRPPSQDDARLDPAPEGLSGVVADVVDWLSGDSPSSRTFIGGLVAGAVLGAALAGASFVQARVARRTKVRTPAR